MLGDHVGGIALHIAERVRFLPPFSFIVRMLSCFICADCDGHLKAFKSGAIAYLEKLFNVHVTITS